MTYQPRPGSKGALALDLLQGRTMSAVDLADALDLDSSGMLGATLAAPMKHGLIVKTLADGRASYALAPEDDGKPVQRHVTTPSTKPSSDAIACANPFGGSFPPELQPFAAVSAPAAAAPRAPKPTRTATAELVHAVVTTRFGIFSDGVIVIESGPARIELQAAEAAKLRRLLEVAA